MHLGLIGFPLKHSFSKKIFLNFFEKYSISEGKYNYFELANIEDLKQLISANPDLLGLNVTIPYKKAVVPLLNELSPEALDTGSVNTILIDRTNESIHLKGFNTDIFGFSESIKPFIEKQHERALILGNGGASQAAQYVLKKIGIEILVVTRKPNARNHIGWQEINENVIRFHKLIVNTTPLGMYPDLNSLPEIPYNAIGSQHLLYDMIYNPSETLFLKKGKEFGATTLNGYSMLQQQASQSWNIWYSFFKTKLQKT